MNRRNNPRHPVRFANPAPEQRPNYHRPPAERPPCRDCGHLQHSLADARRVIADWNQWHESVKPILASAKSEKVSFNRKLLNTKVTIDKLEVDLATKEQEFPEELKKSNDIILARNSEISCLKIRLQKKTLETHKLERFCKEESNSSTARWEAEKVAASELKPETLQAKLQIQDEWQKKVKQLEEQLRQRDAEILTLRKEKDDLSERLTETSNQLSSKQTELLQSQNTWQNKCNAPEEKLTKELAEREESCEAGVKEMEKEKKKLQELCLKEEDLSERLTETSNQLSRKETELLQSQKTWQNKCDSPEEKLTKELAEIEEHCEARVKQMEVEKKLQERRLKRTEDLYERLTETSSQLSRKETELLQSQKTWQNKCDALEQKLTKELAERDESCEARVKQMEKEKNKFKECCLKEREMKRFWNWMYKNKCNKDSKVDETAGCSQAGQQ